MSSEPKNLKLLYTLFCDDVRLEAGNRLSFMGVFKNIMVQQLPSQHDQVCGRQSLAGDRAIICRRFAFSRRIAQQPIVVSQPTPFEISTGGFADNISFFVNVTFPTAGQYVVQTLIDSNLYEEQMLTVSNVTEPEMLGTSEAVN